MREKVRIRVLFMAVLLFLTAMESGCAGKDPDKSLREPFSEEESQEEKEDTPLLLKVATTKIPESDAYQGLEMLKESIETRSGGTIEVQLYPSGQLGEQTAIMEGVRIGTIEMAFLPVGAAENVFPEIMDFNPLFTDTDEEEAIERYTSEDVQELLEQLRKTKHIRCMGFSVEGVRNLWTKNRIEEISDLEGARIRVPESPAFSAAFQNLGASITPMDLSQVYDGLQAGLLDGVELDSESVLRYNLYEKCRYCLETRHAVTVYTFFIADDVFQEMTEEQQEVVQTVSREVSEWLLDQYRENKEAVREELEKKGVVFLEPDASMRQEIESRLQGY